MKMLKKIMLGLFSMAMLMGVLMGVFFANVSAKAEETTTALAVSNQVDDSNVNQGSEGLDYTLSDDGTYYSVTGIGTCTDTDIVIPAKYEGLPITSIGSYTFYHCESLTSVVIPDSVTSIGSNAFNNCDKLISVVIPNSVETIGYAAFAGCDSLISVRFGEGLNIISGHAFSHCNSLTSIVISNSVTIIEEYAFGGCKNLTSVMIPASVSSIVDTAFSNCENLTSITVDESNVNYQSIDGNLYTKDGTVLLQYAIGKKETSFVISDDVTMIGYNAFAYCTNLISVVIPNSILTIDKHAFYDCVNLSNVTIPDGVTMIGTYAFHNCSSLTSVVIPDSVTAIGSDTFSDCDALISVVIGDGINTISSDAFAWCPNLASVAFGSNVTTIGAYAFYNCDSLTSIDIPSSVTTIGYYAFGTCDGLTSVVIPDSVTTISSSAFTMCAKLQSVVIGEGVEKIDNRAFYRCSNLTSIAFKGTKTQWDAIEKGSEWNYNVPAEVICLADLPYGNLSNGLTWEVDGIALTLRGAATSIPSFEPEEAPWSRFASQIEEIYLFTEYVETIGAYAFYGLENVTYINIASDSLTHVGKYAFGKIKTNIDVWFYGTDKQWKNVIIDYGNDALIGSNVFCSKTDTTIEGEHISIPSEDYIGDAFLDEHLSFASNQSIVTAMKENSFSNVAVVKKGVLAAYNFWDLLGDVGEIVSLKFDDLTISANYYELYLSDMILALNNEKEASKLDWKVAETYNDVYGGLKKLLQSSAEWESSITPAMVQEIEGYLTGKSFELGENTAKALEIIFKDLYKNNKPAFTSIFEGLSTASTVLDGVFAAFDIVNAYVDAYNAYVVSKTFWNVNDEFFNVCINAGNKLTATSGYRRYGQWFLNAVKEAKESEMGNLRAVFDSAHKLTKTGTVVVYNLFIQDFAKAAIYPTVAKLLGLTSTNPLSILAFTYNATYGVLDAISGLSKASEQYKIINYITPVEKQLFNIVESKRNTLLSQKSESIAVSYDMAYQILRQTNMYLYEATYKHAAIKNNTSDMTYAIAGKNLWAKTKCHSGNYGEKYNIFSARCPVDVYVYDSNGMLVTSIVNEKIEEYDERITIMIGNKHKTFAYSPEDKFTFIIKAREEGEMDYSFGILNGTSLETEYVSYDISLTEEQEFSVTIPDSTNNSNNDDFKLNTNGTQIEFGYDSTIACQEHSFNEWILGEESKTRVCQNCNYIEYMASCSHDFEVIEVYSIIPDCNNDGHTIFVCSSCGVQMSDGKDVEPMGHTPSENSIITAPSCTQAGYTTNICALCDETYISNEVNSLGHSGGSASCQQRAVCAVCGEEYGELTGHSYGEWKKSNDSYHKHTCECGAYETENHSYGEWIITKLATAQEEGVKERTCVCGERQTEIIPIISTSVDDSSENIDSDDPINDSSIENSDINNSSSNHLEDFLTGCTKGCGGGCASFTGIPMGISLLGVGVFLFCKKRGEK